MTEFRYAECHYAKCHYAECRYAEFHCAECRGANYFYGRKLHLKLFITFDLRPVL